MRIKINGKYFEEVNGLTHSADLDAIAAQFSFVCRYDPQNPQHAELLRPLRYYPVVIEDDNGAVFFTGQILNHRFTSQATATMIELSGYSTGGVLEDCNTPVSNYPLESLDRSLTDIAERVAGIFGLNLKIYPNVARECGQRYEKSVCRPNDTLKSYLAMLAAQRNILLSHDRQGSVILFRPDTKARSRGFYNDGNTTNMTLDINGQGLHSSISILRQPEDGDGTVGNPSVIKNPLVGAFRPKVDTLSSGNQTATAAAVKNAFAAELKGIKLTFTLQARWEDLYPGDIVEVQNEEKGIPLRSRWMVVNAVRTLAADEKTMNLTLVIPETFTGEQPQSFF